MYEHHKQALISRREFHFRMLLHGLFSVAIVSAALFLGVAGYHFLEKLSWVDSLLNASMILSGMGPVSNLQHSSAKWFASFYAIFSGISFIAMMGVLFAPVFHRFLHKFHIEFDDDEGAL